MEEHTRRRGIGSSFLLTLLASALVWAGPLGSAFQADAADGRKSRITIDAGKPGRTISPLTYGTNIFWVGSMNGITQRAATEAQYRQALEKWYGYLPVVNELGPTLFRFPGGLSANYYVWTRAIGPYAKRTRMMNRPDAADPIIGTDEFLLFCEELGAEAMIIVNINRATGASPLKMMLNTEGFYRENANVAANWVEYCNAPNDGSNPRGGKDWAAVRAQNGHAEPYGVKYWELGNEIQDVPAGWYQKAVRIFSNQMRAVDPSIRIGALTPLKGWPANKSNDWFRRIGKAEGNAFDFWIRHTYTPGTTGELRGFELSGKGASISVPLDLPPDRYEFRVRAMTQRGRAKLKMSVSGTGAQSVCGVGNRKKECSLNARLQQKDHALRFELTEGASVLVYHVAEWKGRRGGRGYVDCKKSRELYELIVSGPLLAEQRWWSREKLYGKPVCVTEYNSILETWGGRAQTPYVAQIYHQRDALNVGMYLQTFIRYGIEAATQWLLYGDQECFGLIEGVGADPSHGGERGRSDPHPRPSYYMIKLYRDHLNGQLLPVEVQSPTYRIGPPSPHVAMGFVGNKRIDADYLQAIASRDGKGRVCLIVQNLNEKDALTADLALRGFQPGKTAEAYTLQGESPWSTNEPETCPKGDCVRIEQKRVSVPGSGFSYTFPPHSATALVFYKKGVKREEVGPPQALRGTLRGSSVRLDWKPPRGASPDGYHLYRSRFSHGPFRNRIQTLPASKTAASDKLHDRGDYTYAVRAFNAFEEEGPFSNTVELKYTGGK